MFQVLIICTLKPHCEMDSIDLKISYAPNSDITVTKPSFTWVISVSYISLFGFLTLYVNTLAAGARVYEENRIMDALGYIRWNWLPVFSLLNSAHIQLEK